MSRVRYALFVVVLAAPVAVLSAAPVTVAPVTCADAGVLLARSFDAYDDAMVTKHEAEITKACTTAAWPQAVLDCLGSTISETAPCLAQLPHDQQVALVSSVTVAPPPQAPEPPPSGGDDDHFTPCETAIAEPMAFGPLPGQATEGGSGDDAVFALALRRYELVDACGDDGWPEHAKACFAAAHDQEHALTCFKKLPDHAQTGVATALNQAEELAARTLAARKTAANITCPKVVAKHYADPLWKDRLTKVKPAEKKAAITSSRARMTKACTAEKWSPTVRACLAAGGDYAACSTSGRDPWGYPAFGVLVPTGIASCDKYLGGLAKIAECPGAKDMRDALLGMVSSATQTIGDAPEDQRKVIGEACDQGLASVAEQLKQFGCK